jgi:hypothetical protein
MRKVSSASSYNNREPVTQTNRDTGKLLILMHYGTDVINHVITNRTHRIGHFHET